MSEPQDDLDLQRALQKAATFMLQITFTFI